MRRLGSLVVLVALSATLLASGGCQKKIEVQSGTRTVCTYGEVVTDTVRTVSVPANKAGEYQVKTVTVTCDRHKKLEALYDAAQADIAKGDMDAAQLKLAQVVASDSAFRQASSQLSTIKSGKKPTADNGSSGGTGSKPTTSTPKPGDDQPTGPIQSLLKWAPDKLTGFTAAKPAADALSLTRQYVPASGSNAKALVIAVEQFRDKDYAAAALDTYARRAYPKSASKVSVNGHSAYFGTDNTRYAILAFTQGAVLIQVEMVADPGKQAALKSDLIAVAKQLP